MLAVAALQAAASEKDNAFHVANTAGFPGEGYVLVDNELAGWSKIGSDLLKTPASCDFRGAFGTRPAWHAADSLLYAMPWRFFDRYTRRSDDTDLHGWEGKRRAGNACWKSIRWNERLTPSTDIKVFVRFNEGPRWTELPASMSRDATRRFFEFDDNRGGKLSGRIADEIDVRVMIEYLDGAYAKGEWKESPLLLGMEIEYEQDNVVHRHEER